MDQICCQICHRSPDENLPFRCVPCSRNSLYLPRLQHAQVLLHKELLGKQVSRALSHGTGTGGSTASVDDPEAFARRVVYQRTKAQRIQASEASQTCRTYLREIEADIQLIRVEIARQKSQNQRRAQILARASSDLAEQLERKHPAQEATAKYLHRWQSIHSKTADSRFFLCREAANLYGLQHHKRKKGVPQSYEIYAIGGVPIHDLRDINKAPFAQINVSIKNVAHLLHLTAHYLSLRPPAELSLPSPHNPHPIIFSPASSYQSPSIPRLDSKAAKAASTVSSRARRLYLDRPVLALAAEDPIAYSLFVDAITLLAWDIAWVCKTQGLDVGGKSWEELCAMGRNLWMLLVATPPPIRVTVLDTGLSLPGTSGDPQITSDATSATAGAGDPTSLTDVVGSPAPGHFSHGNRMHFLAGASGTEYMRSWKLPSPVRLIEKIKVALAAERMGAEWEMLEEGAWEEEREAGEAGGPGETVREPVDQDSAVGRLGKNAEAEQTTDGKAETTHGWMKVKSRGAEIGTRYTVPGVSGVEK